MAFYAVRVGRNPGIYGSWGECKRETDGFSGAVFHKFQDMEAARHFMKDGTVNVTESKITDRRQPLVDDPDDLCEWNGHVWVDGSYNQNGAKYGAAFAMFHNGKLEQWKQGYNDELLGMRNVAGELRAALAALNAAKNFGLSSVTIHYDYTGIEAWATGKWNTTVPFIKMVYIPTFRQAMTGGMVVHFEHVRGHSGDVMNDMVDRLAKQACGVLTN